ncbi:MAG TPA: DUF4129 domain-containing protein [Acidimicrobiales bacterium]|nr:DUF4129 domain-containing protein [Acidimicrobiales bacterium]
MARSDESAARDAPGRNGARGVREGVGLVAIGVALLCVAAWSASRSSIGGSSPDIPTSVDGSEAVLNDALLVAAGALVAVLVIFVAPAWFRQGRGRAARRADEEPRPAKFWLGLLAGVAVILAIALFIMLASRNQPADLPPLSEAPATTEPAQPSEGERAGARGWTATALFAAGALAVGIGVLVWHTRGRGQGWINVVDDRELPQTSTPIDFEALAPADAVRAAYAAARNALEPLGVSSRAPETPYEYLDRVRANAPGVERQVTTLTRLFEVARFSHHPVTPAMKADAIAAYTIVADESKRAREAAQDRDTAALT